MSFAINFDSKFDLLNFEIFHEQEMKKIDEKNPFNLSQYINLSAA